MHLRALSIVLFWYPSTAVAQESKQIFDAPVRVLTGYETFQDTADLDGDGDWDALCLEQDDTLFTYLFVVARANDGTGRFEPAWKLRTELFYFTWSELQVADLDGDPVPDFAVRSGPFLHFYRGRGLEEPLFFTSQLLPGAWADTVWRLADLDSDGRDDLAVVHEGRTWLFLNQGPGTNPKLTGTKDDAARDVLLADLDGDGVVELIQSKIDASAIVVQSVPGGQLGPNHLFEHPSLGNLDQIQRTVLGRRPRRRLRPRPPRLLRSGAICDVRASRAARLRLVRSLARGWRHPVDGRQRRRSPGRRRSSLEGHHAFATDTAPGPLRDLCPTSRR